MSLLFFREFLILGRSFVEHGDGKNQHYQAYAYYATYLRGIIRNLLDNHRLIIPQWDFAIGEGSDIIQTLHYYVIGDPFAFFSVFVPSEYMHIYYSAMCLLRIYLSGIAFSYLCFSTGKKAGVAVLAGALTYVFCSWNLLNICRHPYFLNPLVFFPFVVAGVEKFFTKEEKHNPILFVVSVAIAALSNFYYFYVIVLLTIAYVAARGLCLYSKEIKGLFIAVKANGGEYDSQFLGKDIKVLFNTVKEIFLWALLALGIAMVIFFPVSYSFLTDARMGSQKYWNLLYPFKYYIVLPSCLFTVRSQYWIYIGLSAPTLLAYYQLFKNKKENNFLKTLCTICLVFLCFPCFGQIFNGFSYEANKWSWACSLLGAYVLVTQWDELANFQKKDSICILVAGAVYIGLYKVLAHAGIKGVFVQYILLACFIFVWKQHFLPKTLLAMAVLCASIFFNVLSFSKGGYAQKGCSKEMLQSIWHNETDLILEAAGASDAPNNFFRYSGRNLNSNVNIHKGLSACNYYWTTSNNAVVQFRKDLELSGEGSFDTVYLYSGYDDRTVLNTLTGVKYFYSSESDTRPIPYDFVQSSVPAVYENPVPLPLGYTYTACVPKDAWNGLSGVQRQEALLQGCLMEAGAEELSVAQLQFSSSEIPYELVIDDTAGGVSFADNAFTVTKKNASVVVEFSGLPVSETYIRIAGLQYEGASLTHLTVTGSNGCYKTITYTAPSYSWYTNQHNFCVNLNYEESPIASATITFEKPGTYRFDSLSVICQPMADYEKQVRALAEDTLENVRFEPNMVSGTISVAQPKILCLSIPYSKGWKATVDGKKQKLYKANDMYMALVMDAGEHSVSLRYATPFLKLGALISLLSLGVFVFILYRRNRTQA